MTKSNSIFIGKKNNAPSTPILPSTGGNDVIPMSFPVL